MALTLSDYEEFVVRKMMDVGGYSMTHMEAARYLGKYSYPSDATIESYLSYERDTESQSHYNTVQSNLTTIRNEAGT